MKKTPSLVLCAAAAGAVVALSSCKPSQPVVEQAATPTPAATATPAPSIAPTAVAAPAPTTSAGIDLKDPVATVNGVPITKAELDEAFNNAVQASGVKVADLSDAQKLEGYHQLLDELILDKIVSKAAANVVVSQADIDAELAKVKSQFPSEQEFDKQLTAAGQTPDKMNDSIKKMLQQQHWMDSQLGDKVLVTDAEAQAFYDSNASEFQEGPTVKASHILFLVKKDDPDSVVQAKLAEANKAYARAKKGEDFNKLAKELSEEPGAKDSGGDLGYFTKDKMVPEFADVAFTQKVGTISKPVRTQFGWHIIKVTDTKPARKVPYSEVKDQVLAYLKSDKQRKAMQDLLKNLRDSAKVENNLPPVPAAAPGAAPDASSAMPGSLQGMPGDQGAPSDSQGLPSMPSSSPSAQ